MFINCIGNPKLVNEEKCCQETLDFIRNLLGIPEHIDEFVIHSACVEYFDPRKETGFRIKSIESWRCYPKEA